MNTYILNLHCPDRPGIVHGVTAFLLSQSSNIEEAAQFNDAGTGLFFMRVQFASPKDIATIQTDLDAFSLSQNMKCTLHDATRP